MQPTVFTLLSTLIMPSICFAVFTPPSTPGARETPDHSQAVAPTLPYDWDTVELPRAPSIAIPDGPATPPTQPVTPRTATISIPDGSSQPPANS